MKITKNQLREMIKEIFLKEHSIFDKATNLWYYSSISDKDIPDSILSVLEKNAVPVYKTLASRANDCGVASSCWLKVFKKNGIKAKIVDGNYNPHHIPGTSHPSSTDHVWIELGNDILFDPTAGQFGSNIDNENYWIDSETRAYSDTPPTNTRVTESYLREMIKEVIIAEQATLAMSYPGIIPNGNLPAIMSQVLPSLRWKHLGKNDGAIAVFNPIPGGEFDLTVEINPDKRDGGYQVLVHAPFDAEIDRYNQYPVSQSNLKQETIKGMVNVLRSLFSKTSERVKDL